MTEDEARQALIDLKEFVPSADESWVDIHLEHIRGEGDGYWVRPFAAEYIKRIEGDIQLG